MVSFVSIHFINENTEATAQDKGCLDLTPKAGIRILVLFLKKKLF
jgi:hypothetical protein